MFQSIHTIDLYTYKIIDSDFTENIHGDQTYRFPSIDAIIKCYSFRNLDVAYNLFLHHIYYSSLMYVFHVPIDEIIELSQDNPVYIKYVSRIKKYVKSYKKMKAFW